jgi:hypothetical protein
MLRRIISYPPRRALAVRRGDCESNEVTSQRVENDRPSLSDGEGAMVLTPRSRSFGRVGGSALID